jgi:hypothetical protein
MRPSSGGSCPLRGDDEFALLAGSEPVAGLAQMSSGAVVALGRGLVGVAQARIQAPSTRVRHPRPADPTRRTTPSAPVRHRPGPPAVTDARSGTGTGLRPPPARPTDPGPPATHPAPHHDPRPTTPLSPPSQGHSATPQPVNGTAWPATATSPTQRWTTTDPWCDTRSHAVSGLVGRRFDGWSCRLRSPGPVPMACPHPGVRRW